MWTTDKLLEGNHVSELPVRYHSTMVSSKLVITLVYSAAFFGLGLVLAMLGPELLYLALNTESSLDTMGFMFMGRR